MPPHRPITRDAPFGGLSVLYPSVQARRQALRQPHTQNLHRPTATHGKITHEMRRDDARIAVFPHACQRGNHQRLNTPATDRTQLPVGPQRKQRASVPRGRARRGHDHRHRPGFTSGSALRRMGQRDAGIRSKHNRSSNSESHAAVGNTVSPSECGAAGQSTRNAS